MVDEFDFVTVDDALGELLDGSRGGLRGKTAVRQHAERQAVVVLVGQGDKTRVTQHIFCLAQWGEGEWLFVARKGAKLAKIYGEWRPASCGGCYGLSRSRGHGLHEGAQDGIDGIGVCEDLGNVGIEDNGNRSGLVVGGEAVGLGFGVVEIVVGR